MFKTINSIILVVLLTVPAILVFSEMKPMPIDKVLAEIRQEQGIKSNDTIKMEKVSPAKLEELGDSVMEVMIGNSALHDQMDKMMGGDGSARLTAVHQRIAYNYLSGYPLGMMNLMSGGMMGFNINNTNYARGGRYIMNGFGPGLMGGFGWGFGGMFMGLIFLIIIILAIVFIVRAVSKGGLNGSNESAMDILKKRYAKGEITKDDFEKMKKDL